MNIPRLPQPLRGRSSAAAAPGPAAASAALPAPGAGAGAVEHRCFFDPRSGGGGEEGGVGVRGSGFGLRKLWKARSRLYRNRNFSLNRLPFILQCFSKINKIDTFFCTPPNSAFAEKSAIFSDY